MNDTPAKKPYAAPRLVVYGDLRTITENRRRSGADGGTGGNQMSS
jgi:hypothetical protein